jgi:predicted amidohydrolase
MYAAMRDAGADVILVPSAFTKMTGSAGHWHTLLKARAIENQVYIAAAAQVGPHNSSRSSYGHSLIVDPFGKVEIDLEGDENSIGVCQISTDHLASVRLQMPVQFHRHNADSVVNIVVEKLDTV